MRYLPAQVKEALDIPEERLRHWRRTLPPLQGRRGYGPCFSPGDMLALKVISRLHALGIEIGWLKPHAQSLFSACEVAWFVMEDKVLVVDAEQLEIVSDERLWSARPRICVPLGPLIRELRMRLSEEDGIAAQPQIAFPPFGVVQGGSR